MCAGMPLSRWRTTKASLSIASSVARVSSSDSPLLVDELATSKLTTRAPRRRAASSKLVRVRVDASKNRLTMVRPASGVASVPARAWSRSAAARSSRAVMRLRPRPSRVSKWRRRPWASIWMADMGSQNGISGDSARASARQVGATVLRESGSPRRGAQLYKDAAPTACTVEMVDAKRPRRIAGPGWVHGPGSGGKWTGGGLCSPNSTARAPGRRGGRHRRTSPRG